MENLTTILDRNQKTNDVMAVQLSAENETTLKYGLQKFILSGDLAYTHDRRSPFFIENEKPIGIFMNMSNLYLVLFILTNPNCQRLKQSEIRHLKNGRLPYRHEMEKILENRAAINHTLCLLGYEDYQLKEDTLNQYWYFRPATGALERRLLVVKEMNNYDDSGTLDVFPSPITPYPNTENMGPDVILAHSYPQEPLRILQFWGESEQYYVLPVRCKVDANDPKSPIKNGRVYWENEELRVENPIEFYRDENHQLHVIVERHIFTKQSGLYRQIGHETVEIVPDKL